MADATNKVYYCPVEVVLDLLGSEWKPSVLRQMCGGIETVGELRQRLPLINGRALDALLSQLQRDGLIDKTLHSDHRAREAYSLTATGARLGPLLESLAKLGAEYARERGLELLDKEPEEPVKVASESPRWEAWSWLPL
jgi:DNA-binding HxlR family transcriptional regulator